jgi:hypothetical protein
MASNIDKTTSALKISGAFFVRLPRISGFST